MISIIVLTYNALDYTKKCLKSIRENTSNDYELIVIDNNSDDDTKAWLKRQKYIDHLILNKENNGVAGGRNQGLELSSGDVVIFLDNDTVVKSGWDVMILGEFEDPNVGVVGKNGTNVRTLDPLTWGVVERNGGRGYCDVVPGFCFAFRRDLIGLVGWKWEDFPNGKFWHEDLEFCYRVKLAGFDILTNENIPIIHYEHKSMGENVKGAESVLAVPGFYENARYIKQRMRQSNIISYYRAWHGFDHWSSYDRIARGISEALRDLGVVVIRKGYITDQPHSFDLCKGVDLQYMGRRFVCMFLENDRPPKNWHEPIKNITGVFAGSPHFYYSTLEEPYADKVINVSPVGIETDIYNFDVKPLKDFYPDQFKFLVVGATQPRKGTWELLETYYQTFRGRKDVILIIKDGDYGQRHITEKKIKQYTSYKDCPPIKYIWENWSSDYLARVYKTVSLNGAYVSAHKGEGFGMPHLEALACGCRIGTTNFGGPRYNLRYEDDGEPINGVTLFRFDLETSKFHNHPGEPYYSKGENPQWAVPDQMHISNWLVNVVKEKYNKKKMKESSEYICERFDYMTRAKAIISVLKQYE